VCTLSGGERNRLLLARLFARPANVLVLDEPTNDLDIDTLDLLEQLLQDYQGTVFLVSHDRTFLNNVVTSMIAYEGDGRWREYEGGYEDYRVQKAHSDQLIRADSLKSPDVQSPAKSTIKPNTAELAKKAILSNKEKIELEKLPAQIEALESEQLRLSEQLADPTLYEKDLKKSVALKHQSLELDQQIQVLMQRWEYLLEREVK
jgi:ATP-binding cassette subfamily F protein uup